MRGLQTVAGLMIVAIGVLAFVDRERPAQARRSYYLYDVNLSVRARATLACAMVLIGFVLLFTAA